MIHKRPDVRQPEPSTHEMYEQLCGVASSGALTASEWKQLSEHLKDCPRCREELPQYQEIANSGMALLAPNDVSLDVENGWSPESAVARCLRRLQEEEVEAQSAENGVISAHLNPQHWWQRIPLPRLNSALPYAAVGIVVATVSVSLYILGIRTAERRVNTDPQAGVRLGSTLDALLREHGDLERQLQLRTSDIEQISRRLSDEKAQLDKWQALKREADDTIYKLQHKTSEQEIEQTAIRSQNRVLEADRLAVSEKLKESEANLVVTQSKFDSTRDQHATDLAQIARLEDQINSTSRHPQPVAYVGVEQQEIMNDPDLRELMGARDLFIADVYDIDKGGLPRKPFGRVFYTRGRSLLFYAFDLDRQPGVKAASTFQVWGRRGYGDNRPLNMGMMYLDSETSKRWVLKYSDAKALSQVDAVFVTIEPHGGSETPKGRQLLYASLRTPANHP
jgi:hypothetical protein